MFTTPSEIFRLALTRHQMPWNWTLHVVSLVCFAVTLFSHSYLMLAATLILFGTGFFVLNLPEMPDNRWRTYVLRMVEWEKDWIAYPWTFRKMWRFLFVVLVAGVTLWALWIGEVAVLGLLIGFAYLMRVVKENKENEVDL